MKKITKLLICMIALVTVLIIPAVAPSSAQAHSIKLSRATSNLRGTWHRKYSEDGFAKTIEITSHTIRLHRKAQKISITAHGNNHYTFHFKSGESFDASVKYKTLYGKHRRVLNIHCGAGFDTPTEVYYKGRK